MRSLTLFLLLFIASKGIAQFPGERVYIIDAGELFSTVEYTPSEKEQLIKVFGSEKAEEIMKYSNESQWPLGIATLEKRNTNRIKMPAYKVWKIATLGDLDILHVPMSENKEMTGEMQLTRDIYFIVGDKGVIGTPGTSANNIPDTPELDASGPMDITKVTITDINRIYKGYDFASDVSTASAVEDESSEEVLGTINEFVSEEKWPKAIQSAASRQHTGLAKLNTYTMFFVMMIESGNEKKILVHVPFEENQQLPEDMRPADEEGFYMVVDAAAVQF